MMIIHAFDFIVLCFLFGGIAECFYATSTTAFHHSNFLFQATFTWDKKLDRHERRQRFRLFSSSTVVQENKLDNLEHGEKRMYCPGCNRPLIQCLCDFIPQEKICLNTKILILQHPVEARRKTVSTVPLLNLVLEHCEVLVGRSFQDKLGTILDDAIAQQYLPLVLFPSNDAITLDDPEDLKEKWYPMIHSPKQLPSSSKNNHESNDSWWCNQKFLLIVVDGTWTQAKRMVRYTPVLLDRCQAVQFQGSTEPSIYDSIRKQPNSYCLSTLESCARTLKLLEPGNRRVDKAHGYLYASLKSLIRTQMEQERIALEAHPESIRNSTKLEWKKQRQRDLEDWMTYDPLLETKVQRHEGDIIFERDLGKGYIIRSLSGSRLSDVEFVDYVWPNRSKRSFKMIERQLMMDNVNATKTGCSCCLGMEYNGTLVGCIIRYQNGSLGILHVDVEHRRKGLGEALLKSAMDSTIHRSDPLFAYILDGNTQSEGLFTKLGWVLEDPEYTVKGTGNRRSKRKWIYLME